MLLIKRGLPLSDEAATAYIDAWRDLLDLSSSLESHEIQRGLFEHMYSNLNILDGKTNSLIQLSGILVAAFAFTTTVSDLHFDSNSRLLFACGSVYAAVAAYLCLRVIWLHWSSREDLTDGHRHMISLIHVRNVRTVQYRRAWTFAALGLVLLVCMLIDLRVWRLQGSIFLPVSIGVVCHMFIAFVYDDVVLALSRITPLRH